MTSFGSVGQAAQATSLAGQLKALPGLADKWKAALQQKEPRELGSILAEVKGLGVKAEKAFLAAVVKKEETAVSGSAMSLGESVAAGLSVEQRAEVAKELFSLKGLKGHFFSKASLESKLAKYLGNMGQDKASWVAMKDEMVQGTGVAQGGVSIFQQIAQPVAEQLVQQAGPEQGASPATEKAAPQEPTFRRYPTDCFPDPVRLEELRQRIESKDPREIE